MQTPPDDAAGICERAAAHHLDIRPETITVNEIGLDFRVAIAEVVDGSAWVLRIPRRPDVTARAVVEGRFLEAVGPLLDVDVPDWRIHTDDLIAYPLLPGGPGLTIDEAGEPRWHFDVESTVYAESLADFLAQLHTLDPSLVRSSGIDDLSPAESRQRRREDVRRVSSEFEVSAELMSRWSSWLDDDRFWPTSTTVTHGEVYPAHQLMDGERMVGVLDWTTAAIGDPARDFVFHQASVSSAAFDATLRRYVERGGTVWSHFAEHCAHMFSTSPVDLGLYALQTGDERHLQAAREQLNPKES